MSLDAETDLPCPTQKKSIQPALGTAIFNLAGLLSAEKVSYVLALAKAVIKLKKIKIGLGDSLFTWGEQPRP